MKPERFQQIRMLFEAAIAKPADQRPAFLAKASEDDSELRTEVERLLSAHERGEAFLAPPALPYTPSACDAERPPIAGQRIGPYALVREVGQGGMGTVYLARRADEAFHKQIALKVVRPGLNSTEIVRRFEQEREILAALDHPNVARLLDGGTTPEGLPYFVMEYIEGIPIDRYCDEHKLNVTERLQLFEQVCAAVDCAHERLVVHRDLKPGNILVTKDGRVKLLDFGIAKLLHSPDRETTVLETRQGLHLMTPEYASPEQVRGEPITPGTDVYTLGVVLYELLTGHRPYRMKSRIFHEIVRVICEAEPTKPSTVVGSIELDSENATHRNAVTPEAVGRVREGSPLQLKRRLSGDLDSILLKALRKEPPQRYRSVGEFNADLHRHLGGVPVLARKGSAVYYTGKIVRRHSAAAGLVAVLLLLVGTGVITITLEGKLLGSVLLLSLILGYLSNRMQWSHELAARYVKPHSLSLLVSITAVLVAINVIPRTWQKQMLLLLMLPPLLHYSTYLIRWPFRSRWAGRLLLDVTCPKVNRRNYLLCGIMLLSVSMMLLSTVGSRKQITFDQLIYSAAMISFAAGTFVLTRAEIRQRGVVILGSLLRWEQIESYRWEMDQDNFAILVLKVSRLLWFLPPSRLLIPSAQKSSTDAILARQMSAL
jgi:serine/threonine protein kinase